MHYFACFLLLCTLGVPCGHTQETVFETIIRGQAPNESFNDSAMFKKAAKEVTPTPWKDKGEPRIWSGGFELGLNGSEGNTQVTNIRIGWDFKRDTKTNVFTSDFNYGIAYERGVMIQNRAIWNARDEIPIHETPWSVFGKALIEYDAFREVDFRLGLYSGLGFKAIDSEETKLSLRGGFGAAREFGGPQDRWIPEAVLGFDFEHAFTDRQKFISSVDAYPNLAYLGRWRLRARAAYEILLAPDWGGLTLRLGIQDRYDSKPGTSLRNDIDYFTTLVFRF